MGLFCFAGCEDAEIQTYQAPKDPPQPSMTGAQPADDAAAQSASLTWTAPDDWREADEAQPMRLATYFAGEGAGVDALEIAVSAFPGDVGGTLANINRWRDQLGLEPLRENDWPEQVEPFGEAAGVHGWTMRIEASPEVAETGPDGMLAAIIRHPGIEQTYFIRAFGDADQLDAHETDVVAFVETFRPVAAQQHDHDHDHTHDHDHSNANVAPANAPELELTTPEGWQRVEQSASIVYATYEVGSGDRSAMVAVTPLHGDGGGMLANVNMWRSQLGLDAVADASEQPTETLTVDGREATFIAMEGENELSLLVAIVPTGERTWFFRLSGPRAAVREQRETFEQFVTEARFIEN
ncbi:MAG: hypothetical protein WD294_12585 [Phycisphaeraceae bacterium]